MTIQEIADYVCRQLAGKVIIHRYDSFTTNSVYLKFDYGAANSLRISDHPGKKHLGYRFNIDTYRKKYKLAYSQSGYKEYHYPEKKINKAIDDILEAKKTRVRCYEDYDGIVENMKARACHEKGFWQGARLVEVGDTQ